MRRTHGLLALVCALALTALGASSASATTVTPAGHSWSGSASNVLFDHIGFLVRGECASSTIAGAVPAAPGNVNASGAVKIGLTTPAKFTSCHAGTGSGTPTNPMTVTTGGAWTLNVNYSGGAKVISGTFSPGAVTIDYSDPSTGTCRVINSATGTISGSWQNASGSIPAIANVKYTMPVVATGGNSSCTSITGSTLTIQGTSSLTIPYAISDLTNPLNQIFVGA